MLAFCLLLLIMEVYLRWSGAFYWIASKLFIAFYSIFWTTVMTFSILRSLLKFLLFTTFTQSISNFFPDFGFSYFLIISIRNCIFIFERSCLKYVKGFFVSGDFFWFIGGVVGGKDLNSMIACPGLTRWLFLTGCLSFSRRFLSSFYFL